MATQESAYDPMALSPKGARGLFQFMPDTGAMYGLRTPEDFADPAKQSNAAAQHVRMLLDKYKGDETMALAAYNAGEGAVAKYGGVPPFEETESYITRILGSVDKERLAAIPRPQVPAAQAEQAPTAQSIMSRLGGVEKAAPTAESILARVQGGEPPQRQPLADPRTMGGLGSKQYQQYILEQGGLPSVRPTGHQLGAPTPGGEFPEEGPYRPFDETYPLQYKVRVHEVVDADTINVVDQDGQIYPVRLPDVDAPETDIERAMEKFPEASNEELLAHVDLGRAGKSYLSSLIQPGDQLTIETQSGEWRGKYGRDLGKVYWTDSQGNTIDVSTPYAVESQKVVKESDPLAGEEPNWIKGLWSGFAQDAAEMGQIPWNLRDLYDFFFEEGDAYDPMTSEVFAALEKFRLKHKEIQAGWVAKGFDPEANVYDVPFLGKVTAGEVARASGSAVTYTVGVFPLISQAMKATKGFTNVAKFARPSLEALEKLSLAQRGEYVTGIKKLLARAAKDSDETTEAADKVIRNMEKLLTDSEQFAHQLVEPKLNLSANERMRYYADLFMSGWQDNHHTLMSIAKAGGMSTEMRQLLNNIKAASDVSRSPLTRGVYRWKKLTDGTLVAEEKGKSLSHIWTTVDSTDQHLGMMWMAHDRMDELGKWWARDMARLGGKEAAIKHGKKTGERIVPVTLDELLDHQQAASDIEAYYRSLPLGDGRGGVVPGANQWDGPGGMLDRIGETRNFLVQTFLDPILDVGFMTNKTKQLILRKNQKYAPWFRLDDDFLRGIFTEEEMLDIIRLEREMLAGSDIGALQGKGLSGKATARMPLGRLGKGFEKGKVGEMIVDPMQAIMIRVPAIQKWASAQRVRNMMGELVDAMGDEAVKGVKGRPAWVAKTTHKLDDTTAEGSKAVKRAKSSSLENSWVTGKVITDDNGIEKVVKSVYITADPNLKTAMNAIDPAHMNLFKSIAMSPWGKAIMTPTRVFRAGTVLGMHFMVRNPIRDQVMAATLTKYGYKPVVDWWRGLFHVVSNHPVYDQAHALGGTQANFINASLGDINKGVIDISTGETLGERVMRKIFRGGSAGPEAEDHLRKGFWSNNKGLRGTLENIHNSSRKFASNAGIDPSNPQFARDKARIAFYSLRRVSEIFEEATRFGAGARIVKRAKKGKKFTFMRSVDEGMGGLGGMMRMLYDPAHRAGFKGRFQRAYRYTPEQMEHMKRTGIWLDADAIDEIRTITLDFQTHGHYGEMVNSLYPFFNAELLDYGRFARAMKEAPLTTMLRGFTFISIPAIANWYLNYDNPKYQELPDIDKELFLHPWGYNEEYKKYGRVSRPIGTTSGFFGLSIHKMLDWLAVNDPGAIRTMEELLWPGRAKNEARDGFIEKMHQVTGDIPPAIQGLMSVASMGYLPSAQSGQVGERNQGDWRLKGQGGVEYAQQELGNYAATNTALRYIMPRQKDIKGAAAAIAPQFMAPPLQAAMGYDPFYDTRIVPPSLEARELEPEDVYTESTSPIERALSAGLNKMLPWDVNPIQAGYIARRYTGSVGAMLLAGLDATGQATGMFPQRPEGERDFSDKYIMRAFYSKEPFGSNSESVRQIYDIWRDSKRLLNSLGYATKVTGDMDRIGQIIDEHPELLPTMIIQDAVKSMGEIYDMRAKARTAEGMDDAMRADALFQYDQLLTTYAQTYLRAYYEALRNPGLSEVAP